MIFYSIYTSWIHSVLDLMPCVFTHVHGYACLNEEIHLIQWSMLQALSKHASGKPPPDPT